MKKIKSQDYDYLWTDYDINYIFVSCYLFKEFRNSDFILIYKHKDRGLRFFLAKKEKEKFSDCGLKLLSSKNKFFKWKNNIRKNIVLGKKLIKLTEKHRKKIQIMRSKELKTHILERVNFFQELGGNYFYTEFFFLDKVEKVIKQDSKKYEKMIDRLEEMGRLKLEARTVLNQFYNYKKIFKIYVDEIARRLRRKDLSWLSYREIAAILNGKKVSYSMRNKCNWVLAKINNWRPIVGPESLQVIQDFERHFFNFKNKLIKGTSANRGFYKGYVKIIKTVFSDKVTKEIAKVGKGDILVAETTGPEMTIACKKAGAIITDEGGITSHAAVVSREFGIPCIIGTKIATKVLKDGDLVEVDAEKGIVRKIK